MRKFPALLCGLLLVASCLSGCVVHDAPEAADTGISGEELSIATTSAAICRILDRLEYDNVIGVPTTEKGIPERYQDAAAIGGSMNPDLEIVKSLEPDLVLSPKTLEASLAPEYRNAGITSAFLDLASVEGMYGAIRSLGELLDREAQAAQIQKEYEEYLSNYYQDKPEGPSVLLLMAFPDGFHLAVSEDAYVGDLVRLAGGRNVYTEYQSDQEGFINVNPEDMVQKDPDMILVFAHYNEEAAFAYMENEFATNNAWSYYDAVNNGTYINLPTTKQVRIFGARSAGIISFIHKRIRLPVVF